MKGNLTGLDAILRRLDAVKKSVATKALRKGITAANKIVLRREKANVRKRTGLYRRSLGQKVKVYRNSSVVVGIIGARKGFKVLLLSGGSYRAADPVKYAHFDESGRKSVAPYEGSHALKRAGRDNTGQLVEAIGSGAWEVIKKEATK